MTEVLMWHSKKPRRSQLRGFSIPIKIYILVKRQMIFRQPERLKLNFVVPENLILV